MVNKNSNDRKNIDNTTVKVLENAQQAFSGVAEELGVKGEDDVQSLVDEIRNRTD